MFTDARAVPAGSTLETDLCIIGGGAAGITLAREFAGGRTRVTMLESGGLELDAATQSLYRGPSTGLPYFPLETARLRYFGGSTNHWGGTCRPFEGFDFETHEGIPYSGWPIGIGDVQPFYARAAEIVHLTSADWKLEDWDKRDRFSPFDLGDRVSSRVNQIVRKKKRSFGAAYHAELAAARNVSIYLHANVTEIATDEAARTATRVRVATLGGNRFWLTAKVFVLATGGIENPRLLLLSNRHRPKGLGNDHDLVGRFFTEHPRFEAGVLATARPDIKPGFYEPHQVEGAQIRAYLGLTPAVKRAEQLVDVQVRVRAIYDKSFADANASQSVASLRALGKRAREGEPLDDFGRQVQDVAGDLMTWHRYTIPGSPIPLPYPNVAGKLVTSDADDRLLLVPRLLGDIAAYSYRRLIGNAPVTRLEVVTRIEPQPNPDSRITLARERDQLGLRRSSLDWRLTRLDRHSAVRTLEILGAAFGAAGMGRLRIIIDEHDRSWPADLAGGWHHMGTTRMSQDATRGVVDRNCKLHGTSNLFVAGSSVFATAGSGTPTMTIVALALRLAKHLKEVMA